MAPLVCGAKTTACRRPRCVHDQIFHPARRVGQERPDELRRGAPRGHLIQAPAAIAPGPHRAVGRHRHRQEPRRPGPHHALRDALAHLVQAVAVRKDEGLAVACSGPAPAGRAAPAPAAAVNVSCTCPRVAARRCTAPAPGPGTSTAARAKAAVGARTVSGWGGPATSKPAVVTSTRGPARLTALIPRRTTPVPTRLSPQVVRYTRVCCVTVRGSRVLSTSRKVTLLWSGATCHRLRRDGQGRDGGLLKGGPQRVLEGRRVRQGPRRVLARGGGGLGLRQRRGRGEQGLQPVAVFRDHGLLVESQQVVDGLAFDPGAGRAGGRGLALVATRRAARQEQE